MLGSRSGQGPSAIQNKAGQSDVRASMSQWPEIALPPTVHSLSQPFQIVIAPANRNLLDTAFEGQTLSGRASSWHAY